ncbi:MAG: hypothetical protein K9G33_04330 [Sneathiella sp.]|nr:hypothetical protein [Sneathiella sp.]
MTVKTYTTGGNLNATTATGHGVLASVASILVKWQERADMRYKLGALDKEYLIDMGLSAHQVQAEVAKPFWQS